MAPDEMMVYTGTAIVPVVTSIACCPTLSAVHRKSLSVLSSCVVFVVALLSGMLLSFAFVWRFSDLLHGDGAIAIVAAPITGAIVTVPIALIFGVALKVIASRRDQSSEF